MWHLRVNNFAAIVTMDAHGNSLHANVERETGAKLAELQQGVSCLLELICLGPGSSAGRAQP